MGHSSYHRWDDRYIGLRGIRNEPEMEQRKHSPESLPSQLLLRYARLLPRQVRPDVLPSDEDEGKSHNGVDDHYTL